jgi:hypothetical protein
MILFYFIFSANGIIDITQAEGGFIMGINSGKIQSK